MTSRELAILEASTTCTTSVFNCDNVVFDFSYSEIHFSKGREEGGGIGG